MKPKFKLISLIAGCIFANVILKPFATHGQTLRVGNITFAGGALTDSLYYTDEELRTHIFGNLNFSSLSSGYLFDKSLNGFNPAIHDGKNNNDSLVNSTSYWFKLYSNLVHSSVNSNATLVAADTIQKNANYYLKQHLVPIALLNKGYQYSRADAITSNCFTFNSDSTVLYDNVGRTVNPYYNGRIFVGSPIIAGNQYTTTGEVRFVLPSNIFKTDTLNGPVQVDFGDGQGFRPVSFDSPVSAEFTSSGIKTIQIMQDGLLCTTQLNFNKSDVFYYTASSTIGTSQPVQASLA